MLHEFVAANRDAILASRLGLSIARKVVKAHGGEIRIRNMPAKGCVFSLEIPIATSALA